MRPCLYRSPVVAGRDYYRVDPIHDALVVRRAPVRVGLSEDICLDDAVDDILASNRILRPDGFGTCCPEYSKIGQDAKIHLAPRYLLDQGSSRLRHRVHGVRAHGVSHIDLEVDDYLWPVHRLDPPDL